MLVGARLLHVTNRHSPHMAQKRLVPKCTRLVCKYGSHELRMSAMCDPYACVSVAVGPWVPHMWAAYFAPAHGHTHTHTNMMVPKKRKNSSVLGTLTCAIYIGARGRGIRTRPTPFCVYCNVRTHATRRRDTRIHRHIEFCGRKHLKQPHTRRNGAQSRDVDWNARRFGFQAHCAMQSCNRLHGIPHQSAALGQSAEGAAGPIMLFFISVCILSSC